MRLMGEVTQWAEARRYMEVIKRQPGHSVATQLNQTGKYGRNDDVSQYGVISTGLFSSSAALFFIVASNENVSAAVFQ